MSRRLVVLAAALLGLGASPVAAQEPTPAIPAVEATPPMPGTESETERNRRVVTAFAELFWNQRDVRQAFETHVREDYIQHNPLAPDGRAPAISALSGFFAASPTLSYEIHRIIVDGNLAAVHTRMRRNTEDRGFAVVDIFRLEDGLIVEHWDVIQEVPEQSANPHPMF
ncbi:MAG: nuclear transport factor 2 family protein [Sphingomonadaceae bacterium]|nr:nuclear transport factor 2 family protein [Sphingomonadaceae bacterium]